MTDIFLEKRVSEVEKNLKSISEKLDQSIEQDHERMTRLEDWLIQYTQQNQKSQKQHEKQMMELRQAHEIHEKQMTEMRQVHEKDMTELRQLIAETQKQNEAGFKKLRKEMGDIAHRLGTVVEDLVAPSLPNILNQVVACPQEQDILVNVRIRRRHPFQKAQMLEIDAIADCGDYVLFNETKNQFTAEKVKTFLSRLDVVRDYFPEYQNYKIIGSIASLHIGANIVEYASRQGLLVLSTAQGLVEIQNKPNFIWKAF